MAISKLITTLKIRELLFIYCEWPLAVHWQYLHGPPWPRLCESLYWSKEHTVFFGLIQGLVLFLFISSLPFLPTNGTTNVTLSRVSITPTNHPILPLHSHKGSCDYLSCSCSNGSCPWENIENQLVIGIYYIFLLPLCPFLIFPLTFLTHLLYQRYHLPIPWSFSHFFKC